MQSHSEAKALISLQDISLEREERTILTDVSLTVNRGDFLAITGPNGGGKTTLLRIILKLLKPTTGRVIYYNESGEITDRLPIGYLPQKNMIDSHFPITVEQVISSGLITEKLPKEALRTRINETIATVGLEERRNYTIGQLSGGQLQRALLGRALISRPSILVLDEPLSYIDKRFESRIYDIIDAIAKETTIILVSHEMSRIASMANRHMIVDRTIEECTAGHHYFAIDCPCPSHSDKNTK